MKTKIFFFSHLIKQTIWAHAYNTHNVCPYPTISMGCFFMGTYINMKKAKCLYIKGITQKCQHFHECTKHTFSDPLQKV